MPQFTINREPVGDLVVNTGNVIDITSSTTNRFFVGNDQVDGVSSNPDTTTTKISNRFAGGSGRNVFIKDFINSAIPSGWMKQFTNQSWNSENFSSTDNLQFSLTINASTGVFEFRDSTNIIFTAPAGSIPIYGRVECTSAQRNGGVGGEECIVDLGTATGSVLLDFDAVGVPDIFKVQYNGVEVINTGYRGVSGTYNGVPVTVAGPGTGTASFTKSTSSPTWAKVIVVAPFTGTEWYYTLNCPGSASPPYTPSSGRTTFTGTSTSYGNSLNGGTPFTVQVVYEGGFNYTTLSLYSDVMTFPYELREVSTQKWSEYSDPVHNVAIDNSGIATLSNETGIIAQRVEAKLIDPSGIYIATTYGKTTFNGGDDFSVVVQINTTVPLELYTFIALDLASGSVTGARGPFSEPILPANTSTVKYIPLSYCDGVGIIQQIHEGTLLWK